MAKNDKKTDTPATKPPEAPPAPLTATQEPPPAAQPPPATVPVTPPPPEAVNVPEKAIVKSFTMRPDTCMSLRRLSDVVMVHDILAPVNIPCQGRKVTVTIVIE